MARTQPLGATEAACKKPLGATEVDRQLRKALHELQLAERNAVLWFAEVLKRRLFNDLGFSSIYQYAGEALGFSPPRTAQFIRLCASLEGLPALKSSVAAGEVSWTKAREVAKVATPQTESAWVDLARRESRRQLERRVRLAQTRGRAKRRDGGRQLGLAGDGRRPELAGGERQPGLAGGETQPGLADAEALPSDVAFAEVPVTLSLRFTPEQYARYEAILEQLRKHGERGAREELILAGLEALLVEAGSGAADSEPREAESPAARGASSSSNTSSASVHEANSPAARRAGAVSKRHAASVSPCPATSVPSPNAGAVSRRLAAPVSPRNLKAARQIPAYQIVVQQCEDCGRARVQTSQGAKALDPAAAEAMRCDARIFRPREENRLGERNRPGEENLLGETSHVGGRNQPGGTNRATIPPGLRREILARDGYRCRAPGCGSARFLEVHHVVARAAGGSNRADNLVTLCSACHRLTHALPSARDEYARWISTPE